MANYRYASDYNAERQARAVGIDLPISIKHAVNVCNMIRSKPLAQAKKMLEEVISLKRAVPYVRHKRDLAHRKGDMAAGRFPAKVSGEVLTILKSAEANAVNKGLNTASLVIKAISTHQASSQMHYGRNRGRQMKRGHIEVVLEEAAAPKKEKQEPKKPAAEEKKEEPKQEPKKPALEQKKEEVKPESKKPSEDKK